MACRSRVLRSDLVLRPGSQGLSIIDSAMGTHINAVKAKLLTKNALTDRPLYERLLEDISSSKNLGSTRLPYGKAKDEILARINSSQWALEQ